MDNKDYQTNNEENVNAFQQVTESITDQDKIDSDPPEVPDEKVEEANDIINLDENTADRG